MKDRTRYGEYGGQYMPEVLMHALQELEDAYLSAKKDPSFDKDLKWYMHQYGGRPTPLYFARRLTEMCGGAKIYLKREDLCHGGAHKFNNVMGKHSYARGWARNVLSQRQVLDNMAQQLLWPRLS